MRLFRFFKEAWEELKKVTWLTRKQMIASTWLVVVLVILASIYISIVDFIISRTFGLLV